VRKISQKTVRFKIEWNTKNRHLDIYYRINREKDKNDENKRKKT